MQHCIHVVQHRDHGADLTTTKQPSHDVSTMPCVGSVCFGTSPLCLNDLGSRRCVWIRHPHDVSKGLMQDVSFLLVYMLRRRMDVSRTSQV